MPKSNRTLLMVLFLTGLLFAQGCHIGRAPSSQESKDKARPTSPVTSAPAQRPSGTGVPSSPPPFAAKEAGSSMPADADQSNTEDYRDYGVNQMTSAKQDPLSTFAIDVDTASYTITRRKLNEGQLPPPAAVRVEEFINYFNYNYPQPATTHPFSVTLEAAPSPFQANRHLMRVGIHGKEIPVTNRPPAHLTFLVDTSGSMQAADKIGLLKHSLKLLVENLKPGDTVGITTYAGGTSTVLTPTGIDRRHEILAALDRLQAGGSTAMESGIDLAYRQAASVNRPGMINRIVICSDGDANVGRTSPDEILKTIEGYVKEGITVSTIGFGMGNYKDTMMERFADKGNGNYFYIDTFDQARRVFVDELTGTLQVIAKDVKIQVEFNPAAVSQYRLIGYENRDVADEDFRNDRVDGGEIGAGHRVTALYELELAHNPAPKLATVRLRYKQPEGQSSQEVLAEFATSRIPAQFAQTSEDFRFAVAVAAFAEVLRGSELARNWSLQTVAQLARESSASDNAERQELIGLIAKAQTLQDRSKTAPASPSGYPLQ